MISSAPQKQIFFKKKLALNQVLFYSGSKMNTPLIFRGRRISEENISDINTIIKNNPQRNKKFTFDLQ